MSNILRLLIENGSMAYHVRLTLGLVFLDLMSFFFDDGASFPPLESGLGEVLDPPPTTLPSVAPSSFSVSVNEDDLCYELGNVSTQVPDCRDTSLGSSYVDVVVVEPTSRDFIAYVSPGPIDLFPVSPLSSPPSSSLECPNLSVIDYHDAPQGECV